MIPHLRHQSFASSVTGTGLVILRTVERPSLKIFPILTPKIERFFTGANHLGVTQRNLS